jgi:hypothetical protein
MIHKQRSYDRYQESDSSDLHKRKRVGEYGDYQIVDELGRTIWASEWCRRVWKETHPHVVYRHKRQGAP